MKFKNLQFANNLILILNIVIGLAHGISHLTEERVLTTEFDLFFPVLTQIIIPLLSLIYISKHPIRNNRLLEIILTVNFLLIFIYSTYYHFFANTIDNIKYSSNSLSGSIFIITSYLVSIVNLLGIISFFSTALFFNKMKEQLQTQL